MTQEQDDQLEQFGKVVEEKKRQSREASHAPDSGEAPRGERVSGDQENLYEHGRPQDTASVRAKNAGEGKKTADKWNQ